MEELKHVDLYTDGACSQNGTWVGGYGAILIYGGKSKEISGARENTTNNQMEILAVIEGLKALKERVEVAIYTDSAYVYNTFTNNWIQNWQNNGWLNNKREPISNKEMWEELYELVNKHNVIWNKVKAHEDNELNNRCDRLATREISKYVKEHNIVKPDGENSNK